MDGMTYNSGNNVLARNSNFELQLKTTWNNVNLHSWKFVDILTLVRLLVRTEVKGNQQVILVQTLAIP
jgi:hypothetical protein